MRAPDVTQSAIQKPQCKVSTSEIQTVTNAMKLEQEMMNATSSHGQNQSELKQKHETRGAGKHAIHAKRGKSRVKQVMIGFAPDKWTKRHASCDLLEQSVYGFYQPMIGLQLDVKVVGIHTFIHRRVIG